MPKHKNQKPARKQITQIVLCNRITNDVVRGDLIDVQEIDGRDFYVIDNNGRVMKLAKDSYAVVR